MNNSSEILRKYTSAILITNRLILGLKQFKNIDLWN